MFVRNERFFCLSDLQQCLHPPINSIPASFYGHVFSYSKCAELCVLNTLRHDIQTCSLYLKIEQQLAALLLPWLRSLLEELQGDKQTKEKTATTTTATKLALERYPFCYCSRLVSLTLPLCVFSRTDFFFSCLRTFIRLFSFTYSLLCHRGQRSLSWIPWSP